MVNVLAIILLVGSCVFLDLKQYEWVLYLFGLFLMVLRYIPYN